MRCISLFQLDYYSEFNLQSSSVPAPISSEAETLFLYAKIRYGINNVLINLFVIAHKKQCAELCTHTKSYEQIVNNTSKAPQFFKILG